MNNKIQIFMDIPYNDDSGRSWLQLAAGLTKQTSWFVVSGVRCLKLSFSFTFPNWNRCRKPFMTSCQMTILQPDYELSKAASGLRYGKRLTFRTEIKTVVPYCFYTSIMSVSWGKLMLQL